MLILVCIALLQMLALSARLFINTRALNDKITSELAQQLSAEIGIDRFSLVLLGLPHIVLHDCSLAFKNGAKLTVKSASLYPALLPLLTGKTVAGKIYLDGPDLRLHLSGDTQASPAMDSSFEDQQRHAAKALADALQKIPAGKLCINDGSVGFTPPGGGPQLTMQNITAEITASPDKLSLVLGADCSLWHKLRLNAEFKAPEPSRGTVKPFPLDARIGATVAGLDITATRETALALAGTIPAVKSIFERVGSGTLSRFDGNFQLPVTSDWLQSGGVSLTADFDNISILVPEADLSLRNFSSHIQVRSGIIEATRIQALVGNSRIDNATLQLDAARDYAPSLIQASVQLDLAELPGLLRFMPPLAVKDELSLIHSPRGSVRGAFKIERENDAYTMAIKIDGLNLTADYRNFPMPIDIAAGACHYRQGLLSFTNLSGRVGSATLPEISAEFSLTEDNRFSIDAKGAALDVHELREILNSFAPTRDFLQKLTMAEGKLQVASLTLAGPFTMPDQWTYGFQAQAQNITAQYADIPGKIECPVGSLAVTQSSFTLSQAKLACLDSRIEGSISFEGYLSGITKVEVAAGGTFGQKFITEIFTDLQLSPALMIRMPASATRAQVSWTRGGATEFNGDFIFDRDVRAGLTLQNSKNGFEISRLLIRDAESNCTARLGYHKDGATLAYSGTLNKATLDRILVDNRFMQGWAKGDFSATLNEITPLASTAKGSMEWENVGFPGSDQYPVIVRKASVTARGSSIEVKSATVSTRDSIAEISGRIGFSQQGFILDVDARADRLDFDRLISAFRSDNASAGSDTDEFWDTPLGGTVRVAVGEFALAGYTFSPCNFKMDFADKLLTITATDAMLCQIPFPATVRITPDFITLQASPAAHKNDLGAALKCISQEKAIMTGSLDIQGDIQAHAKPAALADSCTGNFSFTASKGRIYQSNLFTKILSFLSIRQLLTGGILNIAKKGYEYDSLRIKSDIEGPVLQVREAVLISDSMNLVCRGSVNLKTKALDLEALATPFQFLDYALSKIPLVGGTFKKTVIGVPLYIGGTMDDPKLSPRAPTTIGKEIIKISTDIIKLPIQLITPSREPATGQ